MFRYIFTIILSIVLYTNVALADKVVRHPTPFQNELLENPVVLDCGLTIREVRGSSINYAQLNSMCTHAYSNFFEYINAKGLRASHHNPFVWNASFLPEDTCYRCLNDERYRFNNRFISGKVIGYTSRNDQYAFITSIQDSEFSITFVHEIFHSMSMYYGVYDNHSGSWSQKTKTDEKLASEFTEWLGYGK
jgi:hypothetical protein